MSSISTDRDVSSLRIDTTPSKVGGIRIDYGIHTPLSAVDSRRGSISSSQWSLLSDPSSAISFTPSQRPITPPHSAHITDDFAAPDSCLLWEDSAQEFVSPSPQLWLRDGKSQFHHKDPVEPNMVVSNTPDEWVWVGQNEHDNASRSSCLLQDGMMPASSDFPVAFESSLESGQPHTIIPQPTTGLIPIQDMWESFSLSDNAVNTDGYHQTSMSLLSASWSGVLPEAHDANIHHGLSTVVPGATYVEDSQLSAWGNGVCDAMEVSGDIFNRDTSDLSYEVESHHSFHSNEVEPGSPILTRSEYAAKIEAISIGRALKAKQPRKRAKSNKVCNYENRGFEIRVEKSKNFRCMLTVKFSDGREELCTRAFQRLEHLHRHEKTHSSDNPYECAWCERPFGRKDNCRAHYKTHLSDSKQRRNDPCSFEELFDVIRQKESPEEASKDIEMLLKWRQEKFGHHL